MQATVNSHAQLVLNTLLDRKPMMIAKQTSNVVPPGRAGDQTNGRVENGLHIYSLQHGGGRIYVFSFYVFTVFIFMFNS